MLWGSTILGQVDPSGLHSVPVEITIEEKEKKQIEDLYFQFNNQQVESAYKTAHKFIKTLKTEHALANSNLLLAYYFNNKTLIDSSIFYVNQSLKFNTLGTDSLNTRGRSLAYNILGINYKNKGLFEESKKWHLKGIEEAQKYNEKNLYYTHTHGLALNYSEMGNYSRALKLFEECLQYEDDPEIVYGSYINIGMIYSHLKDYESSDEYLKKGLELSSKRNSQQALAVILLNLGSNAQDQKYFDKAIKLYQEVVEICDKADLNNVGLIARMNIGNVHIATNKLPEAQLIYSIALHDAIELGYLTQQLNVYENLKDIAIKQGNYKNAFLHISEYFKVKDSISILQKNKEIHELEIKYETLSKEKEIKVLQFENTNRKLELSNQKEAIKNLRLQQEVKETENRNRILAFQNASEKRVNEINLLKKDQELQEVNLARQKSIKNIILYSFLVILIPIIGLLVTYYQKLQTQSQLNQKEKEINQQKITALLKDQELEVIKASVAGQDKERKRIALELHDSIGGNLAAIKLQLNNPEINGQHYIKTINHQIDDTYQQVRNLSHNLIPKKFSKNNFCDVLEEYLNKIGNASDITTSFAVFPRKKIDQLEEELLIEIFKIIQELITNTIKHARANSVELHINLAKNNTLSVIFEDNGVGFNSKKQIYGLGFTNIQSRLEKIFGSLIIDSRKGRGTIINIEITNTKPTTYEV